MKIAIIGMYPSSDNQIFHGIMRVTYNLSKALATIPNTSVTIITPYRMREILKKTSHVKGKIHIMKMNYFKYSWNLFIQHVYPVSLTQEEKHKNCVYCARSGCHGKCIGLYTYEKLCNV